MTRPLRVGVNLCWMVPGVVGGSEESTIRSLLAVADVLDDEAVPDTDVRVFGLRPLLAAHPDLTERFAVDTMPITGRNKGLRVAGEYGWLGAVVRRHGIHVLHDAGGTSPGVVPGAARMLTIHDIQPLDIPANFSPARVAYLSRVVPRAVARAALVTVPSAFVRDRLVDRLGADPERVVVVPHPAAPPGPATDPDELRARHGLPERFVLLPAITYPHKGHDVALRALAALDADLDDIGLVLTGGAGPSEQSVLATVDRLGLRDRVIRTGRVPEPDVWGLYRDALGLVFPSTYEGFGLPVVEAMASGCPPLVADAGALPEVVGDAGVVLPPDDPEAWAAAIASLSDCDRRARLVEVGWAEMGRFAPERTAHALLAAYRSTDAAR